MRAMRRGSWSGIGAAGCLALRPGGRRCGEGGDGETRHRPRYTADGKLEVPTGFRSWVFVGTDLSPQYKSEGRAAEPEAARLEKEQRRRKEDDTFHAVYINPESYEAYRKTGQFPDPTMLVMEVFRAEMRDPGGVLSDGQFQGKRVGRRGGRQGQQAPGRRRPLGLLRLPLDQAARPAKPAKAKPDQDCYQCHLRHASKDNVWVQFYPALRDPE